MTIINNDDKAPMTTEEYAIVPQDNLDITPPASKEVSLELTVEHDTEEFPEGGKGWLVLCGCMCISIMTFGMINSYGVFQTYYETTLFSDVSSARLSIIGACQGAIVDFMTPLNLPLVYAFGIRAVLGMGGILVMVSFFGLSTTQPGELWKCYFFQAIMFSVGASMLFTPIMFSPMEWFKKRRATALGLSTCFVSVGGIVWPIIFKSMVNNAGFQWTVRTIAFIQIPLVLLAVLLVPQRLEQQYIHKSETVSNSTFTLSKVKTLPQTYISLFKSWAVQTREVKYDIMLISNTLGMLGTYPATFYLDYFATLISPNAKVTPYVLVVFNAFSGPGRIVPGLVGDKMGRFNTLIISLTIAGVSLLAIWIPSIHNKEIAVFTVFVAIFGFFNGPLFSLFPACFAQVFGTKGSEARIGFFLFISSPAPIVGCLIAGSFIPVNSSTSDEILQGFQKLVIYCGCMFLSCMVVIAGVRLTLTRRAIAFV